MKKLLLLVCLLLVIGTSLLVHLPFLAKPFVGHHDWNSVLHGQIARNNLRYGLPTTKLGQVTNAGVTTPSEFVYHTHHPLLWPLLITLSVAIFGMHEWAIRLVAFIASQAMIGVYFILVRKYFGTLMAFLASAFLLATPMYIYFGILPDKEALVLLLLLLLIWFYLIFLKMPSFQSFFPVALITTIGGLTHWMFYFIPLVLSLHCLLSNVNESRKERFFVFFFLLFTLYFLLFITLIFHLYHTKFLTGEYLGGGLGQTLSFRLSQQNADQQPFTLLEYLAKLWNRLGNYFGWIVLLPVVIGLFLSWRRENKLIGSDLEFLEGLTLNLLFLFIGIALIYPLIFRNYVYIHDYLIYTLLPAWGLAGALGTVYLAQLAKKKLHLHLHQHLVTISIGLFIILLSVIERGAMIANLRASNWYEPGFTIGRAIGKTTQPDDKVLLLYPELAEPFGKFIDYYADRKIDYLETQQFASDDSHKVVVVFPKERPLSHKQELLLQGYEKMTKDNLVIYRKQN